MVKGYICGPFVKLSFLCSIIVLGRRLVRALEPPLFFIKEIGQYNEFSVFW